MTPQQSAFDMYWSGNYDLLDNPYSVDTSGREEWQDRWLELSDIDSRLDKACLSIEKAFAENGLSLDV